MLGFILINPALEDHHEGIQSLVHNKRTIPVSRHFSFCGFFFA